MKRIRTTIVTVTAVASIAAAQTQPSEDKIVQSSTQATTVPSTEPTRGPTSFAPTQHDAIVNAEFRTDTDGVHINAHGGGVLFHEGTYYWFGEARARPKAGERWAAMPGVSCYSSTDLLNWTNRGIVMAAIPGETASDIALGCTIERPKVAFNPRTKKFVMWFHLELKGKSYSAARAAVAEADSPAGPYTFIKSMRPNAGRWPDDLAEEFRTPLSKAEADAMIKSMGRRRALIAGAYARRDYEGGQMSRDLTLFVDPDDGKAYVVSSAEENYTLAVHELTDDYLGFTGRWTRIEPAGHNEAPAIIKRNGKYYLIASDCTGWTPNDARVLVAESLFGPWRPAGNPCEGTNPSNGMGPDETFGGQSTFILQVNGKPDALIAMFDVWRPRTLLDSGHLWLPITFEGDRMVIRYRDRFTPAELGQASRAVE